MIIWLLGVYRACFDPGLFTYQVGKQEIGGWGGLSHQTALFLKTCIEVIAPQACMKPTSLEIACPVSSGLGSAKYIWLIAQAAA